MTSVNLSNSLTEIKSSLFTGCRNLTSLVIPASVTIIEVPRYGSGALASCRGLKSIVVADGNPNYDSRGNCNAIIETATNKLIRGCENSVIPDSVTAIEKYAFLDCAGLQGVLDLSAVTEIKNNAFHGCVGLERVKLSESLTEIGTYAFFGCNKLTSVTIPNPSTVVAEKAFPDNTEIIR